MIKIRSTWIVRIEEDWPAAHELLCLIEKRRYVMFGIEMHSVVALTEDLPDEGLVRGQVPIVDAFRTLVTCPAPAIRASSNRFRRLLLQLLRDLCGGFPRKPVVRTETRDYCRIPRQPSRSAGRSSAILVNAARLIANYRGARIAKVKFCNTATLAFSQSRWLSEGSRSQFETRSRAHRP
jgi:hypothetical protein